MLFNFSGPSMRLVFSLVIATSVSVCADERDAYRNSVYPSAYPSATAELHDSTRFRPDYVDASQVAADYRQPTRVIFFDAHSALISTKRTGQLYQLDLPSKRLSVVHSDAACSWGELIQLSTTIVAISEHNAQQVVVFHHDDSLWKPVARLPAPGIAHSLAWDSEMQTLYASGQWSQQLYRWQFSSENPTSENLANIDNWKLHSPVDLQMCGGEILLLPKRGLVLVTDAFGCNYRLLDRQTGDILKRDQVYGHNITSLVAVHDEQKVLFPHQLLSEHLQSIRNDITWGGLITNSLRWLVVDRMLQQTGPEIFKQGRFYPIGTNGNGAGDLTSLRIADDGLIAITIGGTNRVALGRDSDYYFRQVDVGFHPVDCQFSPDNKSLLVVNQFSDSISIVNLQDDSVEHLALGPVREPTQAERGEIAFFDSSLSHDGWMSCHSCHSHGHTSGQLNDNFTDKSYGTPKRVLSLLGQSETSPYSWSGNLESLERQIEHSIHSTMSSDYDVPEATIADIAAYLRTLAPPPSLRAARLRPDSQVPSEHHVSAKVVDDGRKLFESIGCADCHRGKWLTSSESFDIGLRDEVDMTRFNPPSLIGVSQRQGALLHDGRARSLRDLLEHHAHELPRSLTALEQNQLVEYLESL